MCERYKLCAKCGNRVSDDTITCIICGGEDFIEDENITGAGFARSFSETEIGNEGGAAESASAKLQRLEKTLDKSLLKSKGYKGASYQISVKDDAAEADTLKVSDVEKIIVTMEERLSEKIADMENKFLTKTALSEGRGETKFKKKHRGETKNSSRTDKTEKVNYAAYPEIENRLSDIENALANRIREIEDKLPAATGEEPHGDRMKEIADRLAGLESKLDDKILGAEENIRRSVERSRRGGYADEQETDKTGNDGLTEKLDAVARELQKRIAEIENQISNAAKSGKNTPYDSNIAYLDSMLRNLEKSIDSKIAGVEDKIRRSDEGQGYGVREIRTETGAQIADLLKQLEEKLSGKITEIETKLNRPKPADAGQIHNLESEELKPDSQKILDDIMRFQNNRILQVENELRENMKTLNELKEAGYAESDQKRREQLSEKSQVRPAERQDENLREDMRESTWKQTGSKVPADGMYPVYPPQYVPFAMPNAQGYPPVYGVVPMYGEGKAVWQGKSSCDQADVSAEEQGGERAERSVFSDAAEMSNAQASTGNLSSNKIKSHEAQNRDDVSGEDSGVHMPASKTDDVAVREDLSAGHEEDTEVTSDPVGTSEFSEKADSAADTEQIDGMEKSVSVVGSFNIDSDVVMSDSIKDILEYSQGGEDKKRGNRKKVSDRKASRIFHRGTRRFENAMVAAQAGADYGTSEMQEDGQTKTALKGKQIADSQRRQKTHVVNLWIGIVSILSALLILLPYYGDGILTVKGYEAIASVFDPNSVYYTLRSYGVLSTFSVAIPYVILFGITFAATGGIMMITRCGKKIVLVLETLCLGLSLLTSVCLLLAGNLVFLPNGFPQVGIVLLAVLSGLIFVTACIFLFIDLPKRQSKAIRRAVQNYKAANIHKGRNADKTKRNAEKQQPDKNVRPFTLNE